MLWDRKYEVRLPTLVELCRVLAEDLSSAAGVRLPDREVTAVHVSELTDPTPYLSGGELLMTTGMPLTGNPAQARAYASRLARFGVAALALGLGPVHDTAPMSLRRACEAVGLPLLVVPAPTPFLTVTRTYWSLVVASGREELSVSLGAHRDLVRAAAGSHPVPAVVRTLAAAVHGWAAQLTPHGDIVEVWPRTSRDAAALSGAELARLGAGPHSSATLSVGSDEVVIQPLTTRGRLTGFVATGCPRPMRPPDRQLVLAAGALLALQAEVQRRGDAGPRAARSCVAHLVLGGYPDAARALASELGMAPVPARVRLVLVTGLAGVSADEVLDAIDAGLPRSRHPLVAVAVLGELWALVPLADSARALSRIATVSALRAPAARLVASADLDVGQVSRHRDGLRRAVREQEPGTTLDLSLTAAPALRGPSLEPLLAYTRIDLVGAVVAYLRHRGGWEAAARELDVHRNTLRHRITTASRVLGADLDDPDVASTVWLSLRGRHLA